MQKQQRINALLYGFSYQILMKYLLFSNQQAKSTTKWRRLPEEECPPRLLLFLPPLAVTTSDGYVGADELHLRLRTRTPTSIPPPARRTATSRPPLSHFLAAPRKGIPAAPFRLRAHTSMSADPERGFFPQSITPPIGSGEKKTIRSEKPEDGNCEAGVVTAW